MGWGCRLQGKVTWQAKIIQMMEENWLHRETNKDWLVRPSNPQRTPWDRSYFWSRTIAVWPPRLQAGLQLLWLIINESELCTIKRFLISIISLFKFGYFKKYPFLLPGGWGRRHISYMQVCIKACWYLINNSIWISAYSMWRQRLSMAAAHIWSSN